MDLLIINHLPKIDSNLKEKLIKDAEEMLAIQLRLINLSDGFQDDKFEPISVK
jgi:hypothetical protein